MKCLLCNTNSKIFKRDTFLCDNCGLIFKDPENFISHEAELARYQTHQNDGRDEGYLNFLGKLVTPLIEYLPAKFLALDFGSGPGPTLCHLLNKHGGEVENYDLHFNHKPELLKKEFYDVVTSTEVVEHFTEPVGSWNTLISIVKPGGVLAIMTLLYNESIDYDKWWYKNDPTHVVFYTEKTLNYIAEINNLEILYNDKKSVVIFKKRQEK